MTEPGGNSDRRRVIAGLVAGLLQLVGCGGSGSGPSNGATSTQPPSPPPPPPAAPIDVSVTPAAASVQTGGTQPFTATVTNTANRAVIWQVNGVAGGNTSVGTISTTGVYTAPATVPSPAIVTVTAGFGGHPTRSRPRPGGRPAPPPPPFCGRGGPGGVLRGGGPRPRGVSPAGRRVTSGNRLSLVRAGIVGQSRRDGTAGGFKRDEPVHDGCDRHAHCPVSCRSRPIRPDLG